MENKHFLSIINPSCETISNKFDNGAIILSYGSRANSRGSVPLIRRMNEFLKPGSLHCAGKTTSIPISGFDTAKMAEPNILNSISYFRKATMKSTFYIFSLFTV